MRRLLLSLGAVAFIAGFIATPQASAQQSINFFVGGFQSPGEDSRDVHDVLFRNRDFLIFDFNKLDGPIVGGGWTVGLTDLFDAGIDVGFYQGTAPAVYTKLINNAPVEQDLKLRIVPVTATIRFLPLGHHGPARPYIGGGVGIFAWRYREVGDFLVNNTKFSGSFEESHVNVGPVILGGVTFPLGHVGIGGEIRYQSGQGDLPFNVFGSSLNPNPSIDLGGFTYMGTVSVGSR
jgi:hypothetical protein